MLAITCVGKPGLAWSLGVLTGLAHTRKLRGLGNVATCGMANLIAFHWMNVCDSGDASPDNFFQNVTRPLMALFITRRQTTSTNPLLEACLQCWGLTETEEELDRTTVKTVTRFSGHSRRRERSIRHQRGFVMTARDPHKVVLWANPGVALDTDDADTNTVQAEGYTADQFCELTYRNGARGCALDTDPYCGRALDVWGMDEASSVLIDTTTRELASTGDANQRAALYAPCPAYSTIYENSDDNGTAIDLDVGPFDSVSAYDADRLFVDGFCAVSGCDTAVAMLYQNSMVSVP